MGQVTKLWLSCYLVLLSIDSKTKQQDSHCFVTWPIYLKQGFRKSFSAWGLNFKQFTAGFIFEIVGHGYKDFINKNKHMQHRCTSALTLWESNQKKWQIWNTWYWKKNLEFFIQIKVYFWQHLTPAKCFQHGSPLLLGNKRSMQSQQSRQGTQ